MWCSDPSQQLNPHPVTHSLPHSRIGEKTGRATVRAKLLADEKHSLVSGGEKRKRNKGWRSNHSQQQTEGQQSPSNGYFGESLLPVLSLNKTPYGTEYLSGWLGSALLTLSPPSLLPSPSLLAGGSERETEKAVALCQH